jgi:hypothetical protein
MQENQTNQESNSISETLTALETRARYLVQEVKALRAENASLRANLETTVSSTAEALDFTKTQVDEILNLFDDLENDIIDNSSETPSSEELDSAAEDLSVTEPAADSLIDPAIEDTHSGYTPAGFADV